MRYLFKSHNLIGDALYISPAWRAWLKYAGANSLQDDIYIQTLPDHVAPLYQGMVRDLVKVITVFNRPEGNFDFEHVFDVSEAFSICDRDKCHIAQGYAKLLGVDIATLKPTYIPDEIEERQIHDSWEQINELKGCILISAFSASCESRDKNHPGLPPNKMLPFEKWRPMIAYLRQRLPNTKIRFLGAPTDFFPDGYAKGIVEPGEYMLGIPLNRLALIMKHAKLLITIDNGMGHLGATQDTPTFLMYPRALGPHYILPGGASNPNLEWAHMDPVRVSPAQLLFRLQHAVEHFCGKE